MGTQKYRLNDFEHPKHVLNVMGEKVFTILRLQILFIKPVLAGKKCYKHVS